jgi:hypothetical protein
MKYYLQMVSVKNLTNIFIQNCALPTSNPAAADLKP